MNNILIQKNILKDFARHIPKDLRGHQMAIVTDTRVKKHYGQMVLDSLSQSGFNSLLIAFPAGEKSKTRETKAKIESTLLKKKYGRKTCLIALGGGVVGDVTGFVAATYMRGVPYIQVPTSLLAMVDSSVGGKTGINTPEGKNLIGAFWQPSAVIADLNCLETLPGKHRINGWVEALKAFLIADEAIFHQAIQSHQPTPKLIQKAVEIKSDVVYRDPNEQNLRAILNFGHTIGHAIEAATHYRMLHGFAVAYGILVESHLSLQRGLILPKEYETITQAFAELGFYGNTLKKFDLDHILAFTRTDKKVVSKENRYVLLHAIGQVYQHDNQFTHAVHDKEVHEAWHAVMAGARHGRK